MIEGAPSDALGRPPWHPDYDTPAKALLLGEFEFRGLRFGPWKTGYQLQRGGFSESDADIMTQDTHSDYTDGVIFGRDRLGGKVFSWEINVSRDGPNKWADVEAALTAFHAVWMDTYARNEPGSLDVLRFRTASGSRRIYGRARRCSILREDARRGVGKIVCDFEAIDHLTYDDTQSSILLDTIPASLGGLEAPLRSPLTSANVGQRDGYITLEGNHPTGFVIQFRGPCSSPALTCLGYFKVQVLDSILYDETITVDTRFGRTSVKKGGASIAGKLSRDSTPLGEVRLPPGTHELVFTARDITASSTCRVSWNTARSSI